MQLIGYMLHTVGELGHIWLKRSIGRPTSRPAIIENDVVIPEVSQTVIDDFLSSSQEQSLADVASKGIPIILLSLSKESAGGESRSEVPSPFAA